MKTLLRFTQDEALMASAEFGFNCGPAAVAAIAGLSIAELRPHLYDFESKGYTNPTLMREILLSLNLRYQVMGSARANVGWPKFGLARIQWEGPWTQPGVPIRVRYRHSHWVAVVQSTSPDGAGVFDINALHVGGWISLADWSSRLAPWIIENCVPQGSGDWHITHAIEIVPQSIPRGNCI